MVLATASVKSPLAFQCLASASLIPVWANAGNASAIRVNTFVFMISASGYIVGETAPVERPFRLQRRRPCRRSSKNAGTNTGMAGCAGHVQQLGSESLLPNLMEVKG